jgi:glycosyltransferase involved in cell wall biosynthesis
MTKAPNTELTIAGEFWEDETKYLSLISELELDERIAVRSGYVAEADFKDVFGNHDILVMPYRSGTGSIVRELAFRFGLPVIATRTGSIAEGVINDKNGLVLEPESLDELIGALERASDVDTLSKWRSGVAAIAPNQHQIWNKYVDGVLRDSGVTQARVKRKRSSS